MYWRAAGRLTLLLTAIGLATSRLTLIIHELVGHGGVALALGGEVSECRLFWFAGGWINYDFPVETLAKSLAADLGGIVVEVVIGLLLWLLIRRDTLPSRLVRGVGAALVIHAGWYLATGTWHGYGDGALPYLLLGGWRYVAAIGVGLGACVMTYLAARLALGALAAQLPGKRRAQLLGVLLAAGLAGGLQLGLALGEVHLRADATYGAIMQTEGERRVERELEEWQREQARRGAAVDPAKRATVARQLAERYREPPFMLVLGLLLAGSVVAGVWRPRPSPTDRLSGRQLKGAVAIAVAAVAAVIVVDGVL